MEENSHHHMFLRSAVIMTLSLLVLGMLFAGGAYIILKADKIASSPSPKPVATPKPSPNDTLCTQEAKQCADGSFVGRQGPKCEFAPCPEEKFFCGGNLGIECPTNYRCNLSATNSAGLGECEKDAI